jgi:hypothetical protein
MKRKITPTNKQMQPKEKDRYRQLSPITANDKGKGFMSAEQNI